MHKSNLITAKNIAEAKNNNKNIINLHQHQKARDILLIGYFQELNLILEK